MCNSTRVCSHSYLYESGRDTAASRAERTRQRANKKPTPAQIIEGDATALATPSPGAPVPVPEFKIEEAPDVDKLEPAEVTLCAALSLFPRHYLSIKQAIVSQAVEQGVVQLAGVGQAVNVCTCVRAHRQPAPLTLPPLFRCNQG